MPTPCTLCHPVQMHQLLAAHPALAQLWQALPRERWPAGATLQALGQPSRQAWWIESGLVRCIYLSEDGQARNRSFHAEGAWVSGSLPPIGPGALAQAGPSPFAIEALEPTQAVVLPYAQLAHWQPQWPELTPLLMEAVGYLFQRQAEREAVLLTLSPQARYARFLEEEAHLAARVPLHHVASHLGISQVSLSRLRGRMGVAGQGRQV